MYEKSSPICDALFKGLALNQPRKTARVNVLEQTARRPQGLHCSNSLVLVDRILPFSYLTSVLVKQKHTSETSVFLIEYSCGIEAKEKNTLLPMAVCEY